MVGGYKQPGAADYAGEWPRNWLKDDGSTLTLADVPGAAKNETAAVIKTFNRTGWKKAGKDILTMSLRIPAVQSSQYVRLRGTNLPAAVPFETDANGNPLTDLFTNENDTSKLKIPCNAVGSTDFNGCPSHLATVNGQKFVSFDVAAWADLWFYSNPVYVQVKGSTAVAGVK
jgi:hypothetical protein